MSAPQRKRQRRDHSDDSEDEWTGESSGSSRKDYVPHDTSEWTDIALRKLHLSWDRTMINSPNELLDLIKVPPLSEEMENTSKYIEKKIDFDMTFDDIFDLDYKAVYDKFSDLQQLLRNSAGESSLEHVRTYGIEFLAALKKLVVSRAYALDVYQALFLIILESFCKICQLFGSHDIVKRRCKIQGHEVVSKPELVFEIDNSPFELAHKMEQFSGASLLCVAEVKKCHYEHSKVHKGKRVTRSSKTSSDNADVGSNIGETDKITKEPLLPFEIKGSAQHAGQLLLETKHSLFLFSKTSIGIMFTETKVMMTCLKLSRDYLLNMEKGLNLTDRGIVHFTNMYDILKAEDRREVVNALLRLSCCEDPVKLKKSSTFSQAQS